MKYLHSTLLVFSILISSITFGENCTGKQKENGLIILENDLNFTEHQLNLIYSYNFDPYRDYSSERIIQIEGGPKIQLSSLLEMQFIGKNIPEELLNNKKEVQDQSGLKPIITLVNIGFNYLPPKNTETGY